MPYNGLLMSLSRALTLIVALSMFAGCKKSSEVTMVPLESNAPSYAPGRKLDEFIVGRWCLNDPMTGVHPNRYYEFKPDGTFVYGLVGGDWDGTGKWTSNGDMISLQYLTIKGKSMEAFQTEYKKDEEGGGQVAVQRALVYDELYGELAKMASLWLDEDGKQLTFSQPTAPNPQAGSGEIDLGAMMKASPPKLMRMGPGK